MSSEGMSRAVLQEQGGDRQGHDAEEGADEQGRGAAAGRGQAGL